MVLYFKSYFFIYFMREGGYVMLWLSGLQDIYLEILEVQGCEEFLMCLVRFYMYFYINSFLFNYFNKLQD